MTSSVPACGSKVSGYADQLPFSSSGTRDGVENFNFRGLLEVCVCVCFCVCVWKTCLPRSWRVLLIMCAKVHSYAALRVACKDSRDCMHTKASEIHGCHSAKPCPDAQVLVGHLLKLAECSWSGPRPEDDARVQSPSAGPCSSWPETGKRQLAQRTSGKGSGATTISCEQAEQP